MSQIPNNNEPDLSGWASPACLAFKGMHCCVLEAGHLDDHMCDCCDKVVTWEDGDK